MQPATNVFDRIVAWSFERPLSLFEQYVSAIIVVIAIGVVRMLFVPDSLPWLLFIPPTILAALVAGQRLGMFTALLSALMGAWSVGSRFNPAWLLEDQWTALALFLLVELGLAHLAAELRGTLQRMRGLNADLARSERNARDHEAFLASILAASTDCITVVELDGTLSFMSQGGMSIMDIDDFSAVKGSPWPGLMQDDGAQYALKALDAAKEGRSSHFEAAADTRLGRSRWWSVSVSPIPGSDGTVARILSVSRDHSELQAAREQQQLLNAELDHRLKNVLATIQSIAGQTLRSSASLGEASAALDARLVSLARATDVLTATSWQQADLRSVVEAGLSAAAGSRDRIAIDGPGVTMNPQTALAVTLVLHELATNAIKYGALSRDTGTVTLIWSVKPADGAQRFGLLWQEQGGPPVTPPERRGFGSRMIERSLAFNVRGTVALTFPPAGVEFRIDAPLADVGEVTPLPYPRADPA